MSSESSLSWHTPSTEPDEIIEIEKSLLCKDISIIQNATINSFNSNCLSDSSIYLKVTENNVNPGECEQNSYQHINCRTSLDIIQVYFQKLIPWKIPWILLMISVVQVSVPSVPFELNLFQSFFFVRFFLIIIISDRYLFYGL